MTNLSTAYADRPTSTTGPDVSMVERALLCDLLDELGPDHPTLCEGWTTHYLAAHLALRESNPLDQIKSVIPGFGDKAVAAAVRSGPFEALVSAVRTGPPRLTVFSLPKADPLLNTLEFLIHHEDVRRAAPAWEPRVLPRWAEDQIWRRLTGMAKLTLRSATVGVVLERTDVDASSDLTARAAVSKGTDPAVVRGLPSEIALYISGRRDTALVEVDGTPDAIARLRRT